eukprot:TRINITY_DN38442_c0_g1_i1.p1 TRINITY_DN38442_c0_g1~~TRINITY_DN38442_c0_g1_i1.p1  ORF type:complete len:329 (-),score=42.31 TRINITY_DN38442_c0_g1_i1:131-1117(-)
MWQGQATNGYYGCPSQAPNACQACGKLSIPTYNADEWAEYNQTDEGVKTFKYWADWIPTPDGERWCINKRLEARRIVDGMIARWGWQTLREGEGVIDIGGEPGFVAAELLASGIHVTVVDPAFGATGKAHASTTKCIEDPLAHGSGQFAPGVTPFRVIRKPFDEAFVQDPSNHDFLSKVSAIVALYPDEGTNFLIHYTAKHGIRTAIIPCNECAQYFPPHNPTYEGFVGELLQRDYHWAQMFGQSPMCQEMISGTPFCRVLLQRTPWQWRQESAWHPQAAWRHSSAGDQGYSCSGGYNAYRGCTHGYGNGCGGRFGSGCGCKSRGMAY